MLRVNYELSYFLIQIGIKNYPFRIIQVSFILLFVTGLLFYAENIFELSTTQGTPEA